MRRQICALVPLFGRTSRSAASVPTLARSFADAAHDGDLKQTVLYDFHVAHGGMSSESLLRELPFWLMIKVER